MKKFLFYLTPLIVSMLYACASPKEQFSAENLSFKVLKNGALYGGGEEGVAPGVYLILNSMDWTKQVSAMNAINQHVPESLVHDVDFERDMVVVLVDQLRGSGAYTYRTSSVIKKKDAILIQIESKAPDGPATSVMTQPYEIILLRKQILPIALAFIE